MHSGVMDRFTSSLQLVEVKRIQADNSVGTAKWRSREMFSFFPQVGGAEGGTARMYAQVHWTDSLSVMS